MRVVFNGTAAVVTQQNALLVSGCSGNSLFAVRCKRGDAAAGETDAPCMPALCAVKLSGLAVYPGMTAGYFPTGPFPYSKKHDQVVQRVQGKQAAILMPQQCPVRSAGTGEKIFFY